MEIIKIVGFGLAAAALLVVVRRERPDMAVLLSVAVGAVLLLYVLPAITEVTHLLETLTLRAHVRFLYLDTILKIIGIAYLAEFTAQVCRDAGESSVATKVELAGKVLILVLAVPIVSAVLQLVLTLIP